MSHNAAYVWRQQVGGEAGLASEGPSGSACRLSVEQLDLRMQADPDQPAPAEHVPVGGCLLALFEAAPLSFDGPGGAFYTYVM